MEKSTSQSTRSPLIALVAIGMGATVAAFYLVFEWVVNTGTNWIWNTWLQSDIHRWRVVPIAIAMSIIFSLTVRLLHQKRIRDPEPDLLGEGLKDIKPTTLRSITDIFIIGAISLWAGASLGPEASLVALSMGLAAWLAGTLKALKTPLAQVLTISSVGALLCSFFYSLIPLLIPLLLLRKNRQVSAISILVAILSSVTAWAVVGVFKGGAYMPVPVSGFLHITNFLLAVLLGFLATLAAVIMKWLIQVFFRPIKAIAAKYHWAISAAIIGAILGGLYLLGGQTVQFSGSEGLKLLAQNVTAYSGLALLGFVAVKLLATPWSLTGGYRGGLVFPSVYTGVALSLAISNGFHLSKLAEAGTTIGATTGILISMTNPLLGIVLSLSLFPLDLLPVVAGGVAGALVGHKLSSRLLPPQ